VRINVPKLSHGVPHCSRKLYNISDANAYDAKLRD